MSWQEYGDLGIFICNFSEATLENNEQFLKNSFIEKSHESIIPCKGGCRTHSSIQNFHIGPIQTSKK